MRGDAHLASVAAVLDVFGEESEHLVFLGGCVPAFYARPIGAPIRPTKDVDCMSKKEPWVLQEQILADLCSSGKLVPVVDVQFRYQVPDSDLLIDVMSPEGINIGGGTRWMRAAAECAIDRTLPDGRVVRVVAPPYFVVLKLEAFLDRGEDLVSSKDLEDLVCIAVEVDDLVEQVAAAELSGPVSSLWQTAFAKHHFDARDIPEIVTFHLASANADRRNRVETILRLLAGGATAL